MNNYGQGHDIGDQKLNIDAKADSSYRPTTPLAAVIGASAICSLAIPVIGSGTLISDLCAWVICFISAAYLLLSTKRFTIRAACIIFCSLAFAAFGSIAPVALILGPIFSISLGAFAISKAKQYAIIPALAIPVLSYGLALILTGDAIISLASLSFFPVLIALGIANRKKISKTPACIVGAVAYAIIVILAIALYLFSEYGRVSADVIRRASSELAATLNTYVEESIIAAGNTITAEVTQSLKSLTDQLINTLAGCFAAYAFTAAYICQSVVLSLSARDGEDIKKRCYITCDSTAALLFIVSYLASFTTGASGSTSLLAVIGMNVSIILTPCLFIVGLKAVKAMPLRLGFVGLLLSIAVFLLVFMSSASVFTVFSLAGACYILIAAVDKWAKKHYSKGESK